MNTGKVLETIRPSGSVVSKVAFEETDSQIEAISETGDKSTIISFGPIFTLDSGSRRLESSDQAIPRAELLKVLGARLTELVLFDDGRLKMTFADVAIITVEPRTDYEAWQIQAPGMLAFAPTEKGPPQVFEEEDTQHPCNKDA